MKELHQDELGRVYLTDTKGDTGPWVLPVRESLFAHAEALALVPDHLTVSAGIAVLIEKVGGDMRLIGPQMASICDDKGALKSWPDIFEDDPREVIRARRRFVGRLPTKTFGSLVQVFNPLLEQLNDEDTEKDAPKSEGQSDSQQQA